MNTQIGHSAARQGRHIHSHALSWHVRELLQAIFVSELIAPSRCVWLISPWVTDIPVIDNTSLSFATLEPAWGRARIRLSQALLKLLEAGSTIHLATRPDPINQRFINFLESAVLGWPDARLRVHQAAELHEKGILGDNYYLSGSMNFTYNGITLNEEAIAFHTDAQTVAERRINFRGRWGGEL